MVFIHRWHDGAEQAQTFTVKELIDKLKRYPPDTPVCGEWDSFGSPIDSVRFSANNEFFKEQVVILDVSEPYNLTSD